MTHSLRTAAFAALLGAMQPAASSAADLAAAPSYLPSIQQELARLGLAVTCDPLSATCSHATDIESSGRSLELTVRYSAATQTIYIAFEQYLVFEGGLPDALPLRLLTLNREMVTAKFEWDQERSAVRLSTSLNTDSNFDRKAFRSQLMGIIDIARRLAPELTAARADPGGNRDDDPAPEGER